MSILASKQVSSANRKRLGEEPEKTRLLHGRFSWEKKTILIVVIIMMKDAPDVDVVSRRREEAYLSV